MRQWITLCAGMYDLPSDAATDVVDSPPPDDATVKQPLVESAPPGKKAERFIRKHKKEFRQRYGKRGEEVLYATAWKKFGESASLRHYLTLAESNALDV